MRSLDNRHPEPLERSAPPPGMTEYALRSAYRDLVAEVGCVKAEFILTEIIETERERAQET